MICEILPTPQNKRIPLIDMIRGFAVFGILLSNILIFSGFLYTPFSILNTFKGSGFNQVLYFINNGLISGKFYPIFCILFGYGFYMQVAKYKNDSFSTYYARRLFFLFLIGLLHQIIWPGDVVTIYALVGVMFLLFQKTSAKQDLILAIFCFLLCLGVGLWPTIFPPDNLVIEGGTKQIAYFSLPGIDPFQLINKIKTNGISGMYYFYFPQYKFIWSPSRLIFTIPSVIGLFFIGGFLFKIDFFNKAALKIKNTILFFIFGAIGSYLCHYVAYPFRIIDNLFLSLFYISLITIFMNRKTGSKILSIFIPIGQMALTSYILQSILCVFIFYGFGFKLFGSLSLSFIYLIAIAILAFQVIFSMLWLKKFRFGPLEWIWRCLSYKKRLSIKIKK